MAGTLHAFIRPRGGWSNEERAQFMRIERILGESGFLVEVEHGVSDEGDPWCVFCSAATGEVMIHAARLGRRYIFDSSALPQPIEGVSFFNCAERFFEQAALPVPVSSKRNGLMIHPSALLASLFLTVILYAQATAPYQGADGKGAEIIGAGADGESPLIARLKQIIQQAADFVGASEGTVSGAQGGGWSQAIPAGMAAAVIAIAHDLRMSGLVPFDHKDGPGTIDGLPIQGEQIVLLDGVVKPVASGTPEPEDSSGASEEVDGRAPELADAAEAEPGAEASGAGPLEIVAAAFAAIDESFSGLDGRGAPTVELFGGLAPTDALVQALSGGGERSDAANAVDASAGADQVSVAISFIDSVFAGDGGGAASFLSENATILAVSGGDVVVSGGEVTVSAASSGSAASAPAAPDAVVVRIDPPSGSSAGGTGGADPKGYITWQIETDGSAASAVFAASSPLSVADLALADIADRVFAFITSAGDVMVDHDEGNIVIVDEDVFSGVEISDLALETLVFEDDSAITFIGHQADVDLLLA